MVSLPFAISLVVEISLPHENRDILFNMQQNKASDSPEPNRSWKSLAFLRLSGYVRHTFVFDSPVILDICLTLTPSIAFNALITLF